MNSKLTAHLDRIKALHEAATPAPWEPHYLVRDPRTRGFFIWPMCVDDPQLGLREKDINFTTDSRTSVPKMERLIRAQARVIEAHDQREIWRDLKNDPKTEAAWLKKLNERVAALEELLKREWS